MTLSAKGTARRLRAGAALALVLLGLLVFLAHRLELLVPSWVRWQTQELGCDVTGDGAPEQVVLARRRLTVTAGDGSPLYATGREWQVSEALVADVTADGSPELVMLVWRRGNYGTSRPFWDTKADLRMTQHLYVLGYREGRMRPVWMSHELGDTLQLAQVTSPRPGTLTLTTRSGEASTWQWEQFGFWRDEP